MLRWVVELFVVDAVVVDFMVLRVVVVGAAVIFTVVLLTVVLLVVSKSPNASSLSSSTLRKSFLRFRPDHCREIFLGRKLCSEVCGKIFVWFSFHCFGEFTVAWEEKGNFGKLKKYFC